MDFFQQQVDSQFKLEQMVSIFKNLEDLVFLVEQSSDGNFRYVEVNSIYLKVFGMHIDEIENKQIEQVFSDRNASQIIQHYKRAIKDKKVFSYEEELQISNDIKIFETTLIPIPLDQQECRYILGISKDISAQKKYQDVLHDAESELKTAIQQQGVIIEVKKCGNEYFYTFCDGPLVKQLNLTSEKVIGKRPQDLFPSEMLNEIIEQYEHCMDLKEKTFFEWSGQLLEIEFCWLTILSPILENGHVTSIIIHAIDILERKKAEESLMKAEKLTLIGELAAGIGHELRNPLTSIRGFIKYMRQNKEEIKDEFFDVIDSELEGINRIAGELMILAKPQVQQFESLDMVHLLDDVVFFLEPEAFRNGVILLKDYGNNPIYVYGDKYQLKQVLINLIKNSIDATQGFLTGEIVLECSQTDLETVVKISDNGCGIPTEFLEKIGEPFYTTKEKGTGLGLMVSYRIIKSHGGTIVCESEVGKGTTFIVSIPKKQLEG